MATIAPNRKVSPRKTDPSGNRVSYDDGSAHVKGVLQHLAKGYDSDSLSGPIRIPDDAHRGPYRTMP